MSGDDYPDRVTIIGPGGVSTPIPCRVESFSETVRKDGAGRLSYVRTNPSVTATFDGTLTEEGAIALGLVQAPADDMDWTTEVPTFWHNGPGHFLLWALRRWPEAAEWLHNRTQPTKVRRTT